MRFVTRLLIVLVVACVHVRFAAAEADDEGKLSKRPWLEWRDKVGLELSPFAYVRVGYETVDDDDALDAIGGTDGFVLENSRIGLDAAIGEQLSARISLEAATDTTEEINSPFGEVEVRLRDGYLRYDPFDFIGVQAGQFKAPFAAEELRSSSDLLFVSRAVAQEGVLPGRGFEQTGIEQDRQLGAMLSPKKPISIAGDFGLAYYLMVSNGNGDNQLLNDNSKVAVYGRFEALYSEWLTAGVGGMWNDRRVGDPPNQFDEEDVGFATDLLIHPENWEIFFQFAQIETDFETVRTDDRIQRGWHVQAGYRIDTSWFHVTPAYRFAQFDPWADGSGDDQGLDLDSFCLDYHTFGLRIGHLELPLQLFFNYTLTFEEEPRELDNDRIQVLAQVEF